MKSLLFFNFLISATLLAVPCPDRIQYKGGGYLKKDDRYYYSNGAYLTKDGNIYFDNGSYLKKDDKYYFPNGNYWIKGLQIYYPNGNRVRRDNDYYWDNGARFFRSGNFYYKNGNYARRNGKLYRPDGTLSPVPIILEEKIGTIGRLTANVEAESEDIRIWFHGDLINYPGVELQATWEGTTFSEFNFRISTGYPNECVRLTLSSNGMECEVTNINIDPPTQFNLFSAAANASVTVNPGYDPQKVRDTLQNALNSIQQSTGR